MSLLRTAAHMGVASSVHGRVRRRQEQRWSAEDQRAMAAAPPPPAAAPPPPPVAAPASSGDMSESLAQLKQLGELRDAGILTDEEFETKKAKILGS